MSGSNRSFARALLAGLGVSVVIGCQTVGNYAIDHTIGAEIGPCGGAQDSVRRELGAPDHKTVGDEEDVTEKTKAFEHEWAYLLAYDSAGTTAVRTDSLDVVQFRWHSEATYCDVNERRVKRIKSPFGMAWEEAAD